MTDLEQRVYEIARFLGVPEESVHFRLTQGFHYNHALVAGDFNDTNTNVNDPESLLNWYRTTDAYIYELSAYHLDDRFNYSGMCDGVAQHLKALGKKKALALGDGIGDLSLRIAQERIAATYHDLEGSLTAGYARFRHQTQNAKIDELFTNTFDPALGSRKFDAVISLDFMEHVVNVEEWVAAIFKTLKKGGIFMAQNAFGIGDLEHEGSIPMHLSVNNRFVDDWEPLLVEIGFVSMNNGWWEKP